MKLNNYLPSKDNVYNFIFSFILLSITLVLGYFYLPKKLQEYNNQRFEQQNYMEKKNEFIQKLTILGQTRIYNAERFYKNSKENIGKNDLEKSWNDYMQSVVNWNKENISNSIFIGYYFDNSFKDKYNNDLVVRLSRLHETLVDLKNSKGIKDIDKLLENAKNGMYVFNEELLNYKK